MLFTLKTVAYVVDSDVRFKAIIAGGIVPTRHVLSDEHGTW